jgi:hypothetical protein
MVVWYSPIGTYQWTCSQYTEHVESVQCISAEMCLTAMTRSDASVRDRCEATTLWGEQLRAMLGQMQYTVHPTNWPIRNTESRYLNTHGSSKREVCDDCNPISDLMK